MIKTQTSLDELEKTLNSLRRTEINSETRDIYIEKIIKYFSDTIKNYSRQIARKFKHVTYDSELYTEGCSRLFIYLRKFKNDHNVSNFIKWMRVKIYRMMIGYIRSITKYSRKEKKGKKIMPLDDFEILDYDRHFEEIDIKLAISQELRYKNPVIKEVLNKLQKGYNRDEIIEEMFHDSNFQYYSNIKPELIKMIKRVTGVDHTNYEVEIDPNQPELF